MNPLRYKTLLTYLPGMASVVNAFDSPQVQSNVYELLIEALDTKLDTEGLGRGIAASNHRPLTPMMPLSNMSNMSNGELAHDLIEGDSIHADPRKLTQNVSTVF